MHTTVPAATVTDASTIYGNALVEIDSVDDVVATVTVRNRQGIDLVHYEGPFEFMDGQPGAGWIVHTDTGDVTVLRDDGGCGCGGTSVTPRVPSDG